MATPIFQEVSGYVERIGKLFQLDAALLSIETKQNLSAVAVSALLFVAAGLIAIFGVVFLLASVFLLLVQLGMMPSIAALVVAIMLFVVAGAVVVIALSRMKQWSLMPRRTLTQFRKNVETLRSALHHEPTTEH